MVIISKIGLQPLRLRGRPYYYASPPADEQQLISRPVLKEPRHDQWKNNGEVVEDVPFFKDDKVVFQPVGFSKKGGERARCYAMVFRAGKVSGLAGYRHAEQLLAHQNEISDEWQKFCLFFPGTIRQYPDGLRRVPCLFWNGRRWCLYWTQT